MLFLDLALVSMVGIMSPGPDFIAVSHSALSQTKKQAYLMALGITLGNGFWAAIALFGIGSLLTVFPQIEFAIRLVGSIYLIYLGILMFMSAKNSLATLAGDSSGSNFKKGLFVTLSNPKGAMFYIAVLAALVPSSTTVSLLISVVLVVIAISTLWFLLVIQILSSNKMMNFYKKAKTYIEILFSLILSAYGVTQLLSF